MTEREALEREIKKLQNLIKDHKRVHGDVPSSSSRWFGTKRDLGRGRGHVPYDIPTNPSAPRPSGQWRKKYSLNKTAGAPAGRSSQISEVKGQVKGVAPDASSASGTSAMRAAPGRVGVPGDSGSGTASTSTRSDMESALSKGAQRSGTDGKMRRDAAASPSRQTPRPGVKPCLTSASATRPTVTMATKDSQTRTASTPTAEMGRKADVPSKIPVPSSPHKQSRFTWVKNQESPTIRAKSDNRQFSPGSVSASAAPPSKNTQSSSKKPHGKLGFSPGPPKTSKYSWVSSSRSPTAAAKSAPAKPPHRPVTVPPRALKMSAKTAKEGLEGKKPASPAVVSKRAKVSAGASTGHGSRYRWKAAPASSPSACARGAAPRPSRKSSAYRWTAQKDGKDLAPPRVQPGAFAPPSGFKLRSRNKIIRRSSKSPASERRPSVGALTVRSRYSLHRRTHVPVKTPGAAKRGHSRALVSLGRHRLRRLSPSGSGAAPWSSKAGTFSLPAQNPPSHRVIKTRYKIDTRTTHLQHHNPALSYRVKRVQSARFLLQSRLRASPDGQWRGRGMRWIGGELYSVSANKLSRTHAPNRSGKLSSSQEAPFGTRTSSSSRHVASRAVQKSLAIIRHARQKKQQAKNYCMYYNRFGRCNRGSACPYIHDPDKVAVCTRFLRGTCKKTDGSCPFSHKVSKEKMPVCSYFLKGICNNSSCPYSHVYVSRKAAVCQDFIRGYCPQGEKCKKKHTLVCPDFSRTGACPQGTKCKLQHRQRVKRAGSSPSSASCKKARCSDSTKSPEPEPKAAPAEEDASASATATASLPSFISLSSSPEPSEGGASPSSTPGTLLHAAGAEGTGKKLHIKPRF